MKKEKKEISNKIDLEALKALAEATKLSEEEIIASLSDAINQAFDKNSSIDDSEEKKIEREILKKNRVVEIDEETGEIHVYQLSTVVEEVENPLTEVSLEQAKFHDDSFKLGDIFEVDVTPAKFPDLGHVMAHHTKTMFMQKLTEKTREKAIEEYKDKIGTILTCKVDAIEEVESTEIDQRTNKPKIKRRYLVTVDKSFEGVIEEEDLLPGEVLKKNDSVKVCLVKFEEKNDVQDTRRGRKSRDYIKEPLIKLSRTNGAFLKRLIEKEVAEMSADERIVEIKGVARKPGQRAKVAVVSNNPNVDPVAACVGERGTRINAVMEELHGEKIDIIRWSPDLIEYVENALSPAKCKGVDRAEIFEETVQNKDGRLKNRPVVAIRVPDDQLTLAIGTKGVNVTLAAKLCGCRIDIKGISSDDGDVGAKREAMKGMFNEV